MARLVKRTATAPLEVKVGGESKWICACGLSAIQPYCDGSHKKLGTTDEQQGKCFWYDAQGRRQETADLAGIKTW